MEVFRKVKRLFTCSTESELESDHEFDTQAWEDYFKRECYNELHIACHRGDLFRAQEALSTNERFINDKTVGGETPLIIACKKGDLKIVELLVTNQASVNERDDMGVNALIAAVYNQEDKRCAPIVEVLLKAGAHDEMNQEKVTAYQIAKDKNLSKTRKLFEKYTKRRRRH